MELTVQHEEEKALLHRKDYTVRVAHTGATPSRAKLVAALAKEFKGKPELFVVRSIRSTFGDSSSVVEASLYKDDASLKNFEEPYMQKRHEKEEKPAEEPKEAASEKAPETPAETKEEAPAATEKKDAPKEGDA